MTLYSTWDTAQSPFASVLGTNYVASAAELEEVKNVLLPPPQLHLCQVSTEIDRVQAVLDGLQLQKKSIEKYIHAHKALLSPIRRIPFETLAEIFIHCLPTRCPVRDLAEAPLIFTTICRDWRLVALNTPRLWNSLHFFLPSHLSDSAVSRRVAGITLWLERSGSLPLSISFHADFEVNPEVTISPHSTQLDKMETVICSLLQFHDRMKDVCLTLPSAGFSIFGERSPTSFPILTSFHVREFQHLDDDLDGPGNVLRFAPLLSRMPALKKLVLGGLHSRRHNGYHSLSCNWQYLTELVIFEPVDSIEVTDILSATPRMQSISLNVKTGMDNDLPVVRLNDLHKMHLLIHPFVPQNAEFLEAWLASLLKCIQCPALLSLNLQCNHGGMVISQRPFIGLPLQCLETLSLDMAVTPEVLTEFLSTTPNLTSFQLMGPPYYVSPQSAVPQEPVQDSHLSSLTRSSSNPSPSWPHLQKIQIHCLYLTTYPQSALLSSGHPTSAAITAFLKSRKEMTLKSCDILFRHKFSFSEAELETLRVVSKCGLKLNLRWAKEHSIPPRPDTPHMGIGFHSGHNSPWFDDEENWENLLL